MLTISVNYAHYKDRLKRQRQKAALEVLEANKPDNCHVVVHMFADEETPDDIPKSFIVSKLLERDSS